MMSIVSLTDLSAKLVAQSIIDERFRPSTIDWRVPNGNKVFAEALTIWSNLEKSERLAKETLVLRELSHLEITKVDFSETPLHSRFFPLLLKQSLISLTIGYEGSAANGDENETVGDEVSQMGIVTLLESISSGATRENLQHLDIASVGHQFSNLKSLTMTDTIRSQQIAPICSLEHLEILRIDGIEDVTDVTELFKLQKLRVLSVPCTKREDCQFIRLFRECLEDGLRLPELRYFECSEVSIDIPYTLMISSFPKLEHCTFMGSAQAVGNLAHHNLDTIGETLNVMEHYISVKCFVMQALVLKSNPMSARRRPDAPECPVEDLRKFLCMVKGIMERKSTDNKLAAAVALNFPKLLTLMQSSVQFNALEISQFVERVLLFFRKFTRFSSPARKSLYNSVIETVMTRGVHDYIHHQFYFEIFKHTLCAFPSDASGELDLLCLLKYHKHVDLSMLSREIVRRGCNYLLRSARRRIRWPTNEEAQRYVHRCVLILEQLIDFYVFDRWENRYVNDEMPTPPPLILLLCTLMSGVDRSESSVRCKPITDTILRVLMRIVRNDNYPDIMYHVTATNSISRILINCETNSVQSVETATALLAKLIRYPELVRTGVNYSEHIVRTVRWLLRQRSETPTACHINWATIHGEIERAAHVGIVAAHVYGLREYVMKTEGAPMYAGHVALQEAIRKLSCGGDWRDGKPLDECIVTMAMGIRRIVGPRVEKRKAEEDEAEIDVKRAKMDV
ncbi:unnamed protein product [Caenorhabditis sp. 36 PRJEB53466]|nr:unnamed protein product [Caenorhabditis sp. 36 PRJEB53466]